MTGLTFKAAVYTVALLAGWVCMLCSTTLVLEYVNGYGEVKTVEFRGWIDVLSEWLRK